MPAEAPEPPSLGGIVPIVPTPFSDDGALDLASLSRVVEYLIGTGVRGLAVLGVASEAYALTDAERISVIEAAVAQASGRLPILAGCSHNSGQAAAIVARDAEAAGADGLITMPPHFVKPAPRALSSYFTAVAEAVRIPIMIQDNPSWTGVTIPLSTYRELAELENVIYAKIEVPHPPTKVRELREAFGDRFSILGGLAGNWFLEELAAGAVGTMPAAIMPQVYILVWELWKAGDIAGARTIFDRYHPAIRITAQQTVGFAMVKHLLWSLGVIGSARVRNPLEQLTTDDLASFEAVLDDLKLVGVMRGEPGELAAVARTPGDVPESSPDP